MKTAVLAIFLILAQWIFSQNVKIYGNIRDYEDYSSVILAPTVNSKLLDQKIETHPKKGYFEFNIYVSSPSFYKLYYKKKKVNLYLTPQSIIQLSLDNNKEKDYVSFLEDNMNENIALNMENFPQVGTKEHRERFKTASIQGEDVYMKTVDKVVSEQANELYRLAEGLSISNQFISLYAKNDMEMTGLLYKYYYPKFLGYRQDSFVVSHPNFIDIYSNLPTEKIYQSCFLYFENYERWIKSKVNLRYKENIITDKVNDIELYKDYIKEAGFISLEETRNYIIENLIGEWIDKYGTTLELKQEIVSYIESIQDEDKKNQLKKRLTSLAEYESGKPAPIFSFEDYSGNVRNLREYVGKIVNIIAWSSTNSLSVQEIKSAKDIADKYKDRSDLVFIYLSIDDDKESWEKALRENKFYNDIQAISFPNGYNSDFARKYGIKSLPISIFIDKSGNIINRNAPKPSQPEKLIPFMEKLFGN